MIEATENFSETVLERIKEKHHAVIVFAYLNDDVLASPLLATAAACDTFTEEAAAINSNMAPVTSTAYSPEDDWLGHGGPAGCWRRPVHKVSDIGGIEEADNFAGHLTYSPTHCPDVMVSDVERPGVRVMLDMARVRRMVDAPLGAAARALEAVARPRAAPSQMKNQRSFNGRRCMKEDMADEEDVDSDEEAAFGCSLEWNERGLPERLALGERVLGAGGELVGGASTQQAPQSLGAIPAARTQHAAPRQPYLLPRGKIAGCAGPGSDEELSGRQRQAGTLVARGLGSARKQGGSAQHELGGWEVARKAQRPAGDAWGRRIPKPASSRRAPLKMWRCHVRWMARAATTRRLKMPSIGAIAKPPRRDRAGDMSLGSPWRSKTK
ncbi:hypothetical protein CYMTET_48332 [Cymbomonas tetramitiformis]|uniref:Uncharacterized protein n=1 Tax=Cymbomonas tetramitiformis TaxID=36881 RepID=A0AAE0EWV7_9CHLO|nr:hypothetical protein CYMTET_48332 [Cymbomonas tetramitiformis]